MSGEDGQQCVYVATGEDGDENATVLTLDPSYADTVAQLSQVSTSLLISMMVVFWL